VRGGVSISRYCRVGAGKVGGRVPARRLCRLGAGTILDVVSFLY